MSKISSFLVLIGCAVAAPASGQAPLRAGTFVTTLGRDTVSIETYTRTANRLEGEILTAVPRAFHVRYALDFDQAGNTRELNLTARLVDAPPDTPPLLQRTAVVTGDSVRNDIRRNGLQDTTATGTLPIARGALPFISNSSAIIEEIAQVWRRSGRDSTMYSTFVFGPQGAPPPVPIQRFRADTLVMTIGPGQTPLLHVDDEGRLLTVDARLTTVQTMTRRVGEADMRSLTQRFAARGIVGIPSPRDTMNAELGGARIVIDYGRPKARGRTVFGGMVELGKVWRTGANLATHMTTSRDLLIGGQHVPAGSYTLWTLVNETADTLILSAQTGQWGTQYDPTRDFIRIPLQTDRAPEHIEQFTISVEPAGGSATAAMLVLSWEHRRMRVTLASS